MRSFPGSPVPGPERDFIGYGRYPPDVTWPGDAKVAISLVINYEEGSEYSLPDGDDRNDTWGEYSTEVPGSVRDLGNETHMEFGSRVGVWRLVRLIEDFGTPCSVDACSLALERNPEFANWLRSSGNELIGHGYRWTEDSRMTRDEERAWLKLAIESAERTTGQRVRGWMVRSFPSVNTRELLIEEGGFLYDSDASNDELPYFVRPGPASEPFLVVPYSKLYNDNRYLIAPTYATPRHFFENLCLGLDYMLEEAERGHGGRLMTVGIHSRWSGQASRATAVRDFIEYALAKQGACFMRRLDIARFWIDNHERFPRTGSGTSTPSSRRRRAG